MTPTRPVPSEPSVTPTTARKDDGFTLAEVVVAMGVLMTVLLAALSVFVTVASSQRTAEGTDRAVQLSNSRIERLRQLDWKDIGFYDNTYNADVSSAGTVYTDGAPTGETKVSLGATEANSGANIVHAYDVATSEQTLFKVYMWITWAKASPGDTYTNAAYTTANENKYASKRVKITITWTNSGSTQVHSITNETSFAPTANDAVPPGVASGSAGATGSPTATTTPTTTPTPTATPTYGSKCPTLTFNVGFAGYVSWSAFPEADNFDIYYDGDNDGVVESTDLKASYVNGTTYIVNGYTKGYGVAVAYRGYTGSWLCPYQYEGGAPSPTATATPTATPTLAPPTSCPTVTVTTAGAISWTSVTDATSYNVYYDANGDDYIDVNNEFLTNTASLSYSVGNTYTSPRGVAVYPKNSAGTKTCALAKPPAAAPTTCPTITITNYLGGSITFNWTSVPDAVWWDYYYDANNNNVIDNGEYRGTNPTSARSVTLSGYTMPYGVAVYPGSDGGTKACPVKRPGI